MSRWIVSLALCLFAWPVLAMDDEMYVKIVHESGKVLSVEGDSEEDAARIMLAKDGDSQSQQWKIVKDGEHLKIVNRKSGKVLDVNEESKDEDASIIQYDSKDDGNDNQRWSWVGDGQSKQLKSKSSGLVLDVDSDGKAIQKKSDEKAKGQKWTVSVVKK